MMMRYPLRRKPLSDIPTASPPSSPILKSLGLGQLTHAQRRAIVFYGAFFAAGILIAL